ncbi:MAG: TetR/AcrR family transcriptional regulator [Alphaproteobacteria bacterium HGW-Alphaproteobacteria-18]|nr:MAG: TetR/AcrR family transcriptional regulator [Alphaproteobacteria bacterium HGW-Alphaproteobacteria-18]
MKCKQTIRRRDASATKAAILGAARTLFAGASYETVGIREIAALAGADAALVSRYFGSKEELFHEVLRDGKRGADLLGTEMEGLPERVAAILMDPEDEGKSMEDILIFLHSANSPLAGEMVRDSIMERFHGPFSEAIGGENAMERAKLFGAMLLGISISEQISGAIAETPEMREKLTVRIAEILAKVIEPL